MLHPSQHPLEVYLNIFSIRYVLSVRQLVLRETDEHTQGHTATNWQGLYFNQVFMLESGFCVVFPFTSWWWYRLLKTLPRGGQNDKAIKQYLIHNKFTAVFALPIVHASRFCKRYNYCIHILCIQLMFRVIVKYT